MIGHLAIAIAFPGFNDLGHKVTSLFVLIDHFLYQFPIFSQKCKKIYPLEVCFFAKCTIRFCSFWLFVSLCDGFKYLLKCFQFCEMLITFGIYATDPLLQNMTKIVCLPWLTFDILNYRHLGLVVWKPVNIKPGLNINCSTKFFCISDTSNSISDCCKNFKI